MTVARPQLLNVPAKIGFNQALTVDVTVPSNLKANTVQGKILGVLLSL
jgi:hypothetical protein